MERPAAHPTLALTPHGRVVFDPAGGDESWPAPDAAERIGAAFHESSATGLLHLASRELSTPLPPGPAFWREFARLFLTRLCHQPDPGLGLAMPPILPPGDAELADAAGRAPPLRGGEYLNGGALKSLWMLLDDEARRQIAAFPGGAAEYLKKLNPLWRLVGRVCFHLAENKKNGQHPFAFLATYAVRLSQQARVQYRPLGEALREFAGQKNKDGLVKLLTPVQRAAEKSAWVKELVDTRSLFHPLAWTPAEAYRFLCDAPALEESGVIVRLPDWWKAGRPPRAQVTARIGEKPLSQMGLDALLDCTASLTVDGAPLTPEEIRQLLSAARGLVLIRGQWVEADSEKLAAALAHWKKVEQEAAEGGLTFAEGMRLMAGLGREGEGSADPAREQAWAGLQPGAWLDRTLAALRDPSRLASDTAVRGLKATLRPYQQTGVQWLHFMSSLGLGACLADDMGLGKTIQVLALLLRRRENRKAARPSLLIAPASILSNWKAEMDRFAPDLRYRLLHPSSMEPAEWKKAQAHPGGAVKGCDLALTTYGLLARSPALRALSWDLAILDEAQAIKNPSARQSRAARELKAAQRLVMTGTPIENRLTDLWSLFDFLNPGLLGSARSFADLLKGRDGGSVAPQAAVRTLARPYILRRLKTDKTVISDLPDKTEVRAFCALGRKQAALYQDSARELAEKIENVEGIQRRGLVLSFIMRFKQICNHPSQWLGDGAYSPEESGKFQRLREIAEELAERQEKALIFTQFREMTAPLADFLGGVFQRPGLLMHGGTAVKDRRALVEAFQREDGPPFFVLTTKTGGAGLNLTEAAHVIHFDRWWNPAVENQATDRAFRIGQKKNVLVHKFICRGTVEEKIDALIEEKTGLARDVLEGDAGARLLTEMSNKELIRFVSLDIHTALTEP